MTSSAETERQREALKTANNTAAWRKKVNLMPPEQVKAIYQRLTEQNKLETGDKK